MVKCAIKKCPSRSEINDKASGVTFHNADEIDRKRRLAAAAGEAGMPAPFTGGADYWIPILGGGFVFFGFFGFFYKFFNLGTTWRSSMKVISNLIMNAICKQDEKSKKGAHGSERIHSSRRKFPLEPRPFNLIIPGFGDCTQNPEEDVFVHG